MEGPSPAKRARVTRDADDHHQVIDLLTDSEPAGEPIDLTLDSQPEGEPPPSPRAIPPPLQLMRVRDLPPAANRPPLSASLRDLVRITPTSGSLRLAVISNMMIDLEWFMSCCPDIERAAYTVFLKGGPTEAVDLPRLCVHTPPLPQAYGTHHSKFILLQYDRGVRYIVLSANFIYADCNNKTQGLYTQDFPPKDACCPPSSDMQEQLQRYARALGLPQRPSTALHGLIAGHDFSSARGALVTSLPGVHKGAAMPRVGHLRVRELLRGQPDRDRWKTSSLVCQYSSIGSLTEKWLHDEFARSLSSRPGGGRSKVQLVWPSVEEVQNSIEGWNAGVSIPGPEKNVTKPFLLPLYHRFREQPTRRATAMPHSKMYARYNPAGELAFVMVGSHNLSKAAWGELQCKESQLRVRSYEVSMLFTPALEAAYLGHRHAGFCVHTADPPGAAATASKSVTFRPWTPEAEAGEGEVLLPLPFNVPPTKYTAEDVPWKVNVAPRPANALDRWGRQYGEPYSMYGHIEPPD